MRFVFLGYDFFRDVYKELVDAGHEPLAIISYKADQVFSFHNFLKSEADKRGLEFFDEKLEQDHIDAFIAQGCECFISAGYPRKIPSINFEKAYGLNIHPSYLPEGKGALPIPKILMEHPNCAGFSIHKIAEGYDEGDILYQERIEIDGEESSDTLSAKIVMRASAVLPSLMKDLPRYWQRAVQQKHSDHEIWKSYPDERYYFDWNQNAEQIRKFIRVFGRYGMIAKLEKSVWRVFHAVVWKEDHEKPVGTVVAQINQKKVVAIRDGFVLLHDLYEL